ncbi:unnamed protein product [Rotaria magnacalcarata]|uniref:Uncharacterized protein n=1 Tax=Rotaria magnacalcarata TaxID=392030 RepID=A0A815I4C1_9BILA|nr:unnamed protein product [Rotaria magnacalcarata]CAF1571639.1 unnamed protein product [Rotaria magnacalcarata]CAF2001372.1 unnamed protein product [Rotaria magnacalcarata]CAF2030340.1 unnamed protein product [Rotaria magnacalcarata]CAF2150323.1 unnamed protein product [Rotaria magnacalcarata]
MVRLSPDSFSRTIAFVVVAFGIVALALACVGIGTPRWYSAYVLTGSGTYAKTNSANFFYTCNVSTSGVTNSCTNRDSSLYGYPGYSAANPWMTDYNQRMQNAGALCIVGILFLFLGTLATLIMAINYLHAWATLVPPALLFLACLFMLAGMAEGARYLIYNDYSVNLYQTAHLLTMFALALSAFSAGRIHFSCRAETGNNIVHNTT